MPLLMEIQIGTVAAIAAGVGLGLYLLQLKKQRSASAPPVPGKCHITTNDGIHLQYECTCLAGTAANRRSPVPPVVLIHGWSGSCRYFDNTIDKIAARTGGAVYAFDLRFHGRSDKPSWGFHVHRLAADLHDFLTELQIQQPVVVGTSLGCAIIWAFIELYGDNMLHKCVFVDQAPSQWMFSDWSFGSKGIYDPASLAKIQGALFAGMEGLAKGNAECCLSHILPGPLMELLAQETLRCDPDHLARLMADHACAWHASSNRLVAILIVHLIASDCIRLHRIAQDCIRKHLSATTEFDSR